MAELGFFLMPDDAKSILTAAVEAYGCKLSSYEKYDDMYYYAGEVGPEIWKSYVRKAEDPQELPELRPMVRIWMPRLVENRLFMGTVSIGKPMRSELEHLYREGVVRYRTLAGAIRSRLTMGVVAKNLTTGKSEIYRDVGVDKDYDQSFPKNLRMFASLGDVNIEYFLKK